MSLERVQSFFMSWSLKKRRRKWNNVKVTFTIEQPSPVAGFVSYYTAYRLELLSDSDSPCQDLGDITKRRRRHNVFVALERVHSLFKSCSLKKWWRICNNIKNILPSPVAGFYSYDMVYFLDMLSDSCQDELPNTTELPPGIQEGVSIFSGISISNRILGVCVL